MTSMTMNSSQPQRVTDVDGAQLDLFALSTDAENLEALLRDLFENHWEEIVFGPLIQGAAFEWRALQPPTHIGMLDGYLTVAFGAPHFHLCIGEHKGMPGQPVSAALAQHRRTARAELFRRIGPKAMPVSWGLQLFNGKGEQQIAILLPNPFLDPRGEKVLKEPRWEHLALWDALRARWLGLSDPDPFDRSGRGFAHG